MRRKVELFCSVIVACIICGCGSGVKIPQWPDPVPVSGTVKYGDEPLANASVTFIPDVGTKGQGSVGLTDASGKYQLKARWSDGTTKDGAIPGKYKVTVSRMVKADGTVWMPDAKSKEGPATSGATESIPLDFSNPGTTRLMVEVSATAKTHDFSIPKKKK